MSILETPINVEFGNHDRVNATDSHPAVTYMHIPAGLTYEPGLSGADLRAELERAMRDTGPGRRGITRLPDHEAALVATHPSGAWASHSNQGLSGPTPPAWVWSNNEDFARLLGEFYDCPVGRPGMVDELYWRKFGARDLAPGVVAATVSPEMLLTNVGRAIWANALGGGSTGLTGTATATGTTSLTSGTVASQTSNAWAGYRIYAGSVWGNIVSNTSGTTPVFTVDQWYAVPDTGTAGSTPGGTSTYLIASGGSVAAWYVGLSTTLSAPAATDTSLAGEATTNGMQRKITAYTLTSGTSPASYTISQTWTFTGSSLTTFTGMGAFVSAVKTDTTDTMVFETLFSASFSVSNSGDQATITDSISGS